MTRDTERTDHSLGLSDETPLGARIGRVKVAVRPPDPVLMEKISEKFKEMSSNGVKIPRGSSLAVRSIDGFYYLRDAGYSMKDPLSDVVSVVNYDPVRRTFILSGNGEVDDGGELFWFAFEAFPEDNVLFHVPEDPQGLVAPDDQKERISFNIGILERWRDTRSMKDSSGSFWRCKDLGSLFSMLSSEYEAGIRRGPSDPPGPPPSR
ncbi:MAG: hypothetical protein JXA22_02600 [Candidatus Thermoplasmatota archaeon]|nr:hypothetical protein [Candidatus Thermoplasmatota archaeon]